MNCQEVTDLMQRSLDKDLSEQENSVLIEHLSECSTCPVVFEKMKQLSNDLTLLPKVAPPFSLVDRIMPQLEEIDRMNTSGGQDANDGKSSPLFIWGKRNYKAISGIAAAAIILILIFSNGFPTGFQTANDNDMSSGNNAAMESTNAPVSDQKMNTSISLEKDDSSNESSANQSFGIMENSANDGSQPEVTMRTTDSEYSMDAADASYPSPNGEYTAYIQQDGSQYQVFIIDRQNEELYSSPLTEADHVQNLQWTDDNKYFEYEMLIGETVSHFRVTVQPNIKSE